jgi:hypothetical protein
MTRFMHAHVHAVLTDNSEPVSEDFSTEVSEEEPEEAALKLAGWLRDLAAQVEQGVRD